MSFDIVAVGHLINETIIYPGKDARSVLGSPPAYSMACAASVGAKVGIFSCIGSDYPDRLLEPMERLGVDLQGVQRRGDSSTNNLLTYAPDGSKTIEYLSRALLLEAKDFPDAYQSAKAIYVCPMDWDISVDSVEELAKHPGLLGCDLGGFGGAHSPPAKLPQMESDPESVRRVISACDIVKASDEDCWRLTGDVRLDIESFGRDWIEWGAKVAIITLGSKGVKIITSNKTYDLPALPGKPIDATGGGDSFMGGFLVNYIATHNAAEAGLFGSATALLVIEGTGGVTPKRMPSVEDVNTRLKEAGRQMG
mgnify:CR=1 FL=1